MEQIVVQTEVQPDGNILLFYVDENQEIDPNLLEQVEDESIDVPETKYIIEDTAGDSDDELDIAQATEQVQQESWPDNEITRLIVFYIDNKKTFLNGTTKSKHLWAVACKTMMTHRRPISCEIKFRMLKGRFIQAFLEKQKNSDYHWPFYDLCHQAFYDDPEVVACIKENLQKLVTSETKVTVAQIPATQIHATQIPVTQIPATQIHITQIPVTQIHANQIPATEIPATPIPATHTVNQDGVIIVKKVSSQVSDEKVTAMLKLYIKYKGKLSNANLSKSIWDTIALEMGEEDGNYWHRRFHNFKKHYITMLYKKMETNEEINWPYMSLFDEIFGNDKDFKRKFQSIDIKPEMESNNSIPDIWYDTQKVFLVKYRFDCFYEFQDPTIPDAFLWHEVGRLLDKEPNSCQQKLEQLQEEHMKHLSNGDYHLSNRTPLQILLDNVIALETEAVIRKNIASTNDPWKTEEIDNMVQHFYDNMVMFKDAVCYYVCWVIVAKKLGKTVVVCNKKWNELKELYRSILNDKKENPDMQIDWRYIDVFDIIFDYGMDLKLLDGYETSEDTNKAPEPEVNKITFNDDNNSEDEETYDERGFTKNTKKQAGDEKAFKLLEYYLKNKDKFASSQQKKLALWEVIGKQIGVSATECAHRFRNFKQVYTAYVQREVNKPEMPILWPYYSLCKKVFGYRVIKSKLKNGKTDADEIEDWAPKEIKQIINHFSSFYNEITENSNDETLWSSLAEQMGRPATSLRYKFLELRKSYRKLKTMKTRNPDVKLTWKYFNMMDNIYNEAEQIKKREKVEIEIPFNVIGKTELPDDDDYQCIIVMPEDEQTIYDETVIDAQANSETPTMFKWNKNSKKQLLSLYLDCRRRNVQSTEIWNEIASRMEDKTPKACKNMFVKLKNIHKTQESSVYGKLLDKILALKKEKVNVV
ncbi:uncharacterized protein LOC121736833 [Aricia agestis]|uniref:uncharacterized protein LOC121736833 n=1 Tax=Aricia agestis TaxID=91739 RepID=UPI001C202036|nr:uncharacterized protein LOC121736833 [Aricia agestis]